jgi:hypothetical protein
MPLVDLFQLAFTSYIYESFTPFAESYNSFLTAVGNKLDLNNSGHREELINWLNKWGCRQFSLKYHELASGEISSWYKAGYMKQIPQDKKLWELTLQELESIAGIYDALMEKKAHWFIKEV